MIPMLEKRIKEPKEHKIEVEKEPTPAIGYNSAALEEFFKTFDEWRGYVREANNASAKNKRSLQMKANLRIGEMKALRDKVRLQ